jgi:hypothetical protein
MLMHRATDAEKDVLVASLTSLALPSHG